MATIDAFTVQYPPCVATPMVYKKATMVHHGQSAAVPFREPYIKLPIKGSQNLKEDESSSLPITDEK
jgi:hypothetical protein